MSESLKATLGALIFLAGIGEFFAWIPQEIPITPLIWGLRVALPLVAVGVGLLLHKERKRKDLAPDFLRTFLGVPFERDGMCFVIRPVARNGTCFLNIVFQNQYASPCTLRVSVSPPAKSFLLGTHRFAGVRLDLSCQGGELGVARSPMGIPAQYQGRETKFDVAAATHYSDGKGKLLRFRNGFRAGKADTSGLGSLAFTAGLLVLGHVGTTRPATVKFTPPTGVAEIVDPSMESTIRVLWKPGDAVDEVASALRQALAAI